MMPLLRFERENIKKERNLIKMEKTEKIKEDLSEEYNYDEDILNQINVIAMNNKNAKGLTYN